MHDHLMDTSEAPQGVNGVITTSLESPTLNSKVVHVTSALPLVNVLSSTPVVTTTSASSVILPFSTSASPFCPPNTHIDVPISMQNHISIANSTKVSVLQKPVYNHSIPVIPNHNPIMRPPNQPALPNFTPPTPLVTDKNIVMPNQVTIHSPFLHLQQQYHQAANVLPHAPPPSSTVTLTMGSSVIHSVTAMPVETSTTNGIMQHTSTSKQSRSPPVSVQKQSPLQRENVIVTSASITGPPPAVPATTVVQNGITNDQVNDDDCSDTDMEIRSLDLTSRNQNEHRSGEKERERPMSWEGELSDSELEKSDVTEEQMRVQTEEPMSPMSPISHSSDNDQEQIQIKTEKGLELDQSHVAFTANQTDSPIPARSDSGCELHIGPFSPTQSPLLPRIHSHPHSPTHHLYSPTQSPSQSRHVSGFSSPYSHSPSTGLSRNNSDASQYGGSYNSYSSAPSPISPTHYSPSQSPNLGRIVVSGSSSNHLFSAPLDLREQHVGHLECSKDMKEDERLTAADLAQHSVLAAQSGITRQQLINSPCPICGDKISGFHYGIFSCESCKGFFKRTVQNKKNYVCMRGSNCLVTMATRKKCPACRFEKCLRQGMKLEAIREDRTRGGRSTYQCAPYPLPPSLVSPSSSGISLDQVRLSDGASVKSEPQDGEDVKPSCSRTKPPVPLLLQQIYDVEHLWHVSEAEMSQIRRADAAAREALECESADSVSMCKIAEGRLYKIVKWCKSLPLFRHISIDDQIILLMNSWCELLLLSCCFRSMDSPGEIRVSSGRTMTHQQAVSMGIGPCIERMLNLSYQLRRLQVDTYEYMAMKVIVLLTSDVAGLKECEKVRYSQEKVVQDLQKYSLSHYPHMPNKFAELLLRIPELQRTCHASKEMLSVKKKEGDVPSFNFLFELLRGDH